MELKLYSSAASLRNRKSCITQHEPVERGVFLTQDKPEGWGTRMLKGDHQHAKRRAAESGTDPDVFGGQRGVGLDQPRSSWMQQGSRRKGHFSGAAKVGTWSNYFVAVPTGSLICGSAARLAARTQRGTGELSKAPCNPPFYSLAEALSSYMRGEKLMENACCAACYAHSTAQFGE